MQTGRILKTGLAVGVIANVYDFVTNMYIFPMLGPPPAYMNDMANLSIPWLVFADFVAVLIFVWFFDKVRAAFGPGGSGGAMYGLNIGIVINVPLWFIVALLFKQFGVRDAVMWTCFGVLWSVIMGALAGVIYDKTGPAKA